MTRYRIAALLLVAAMVGCDPQDCSLGYDAGEQFRITVKGMLVTSDYPCEVAVLGPGSSFTLTADNNLLPVAGTNQCYSRPATSEVPEIWSGMVSECEGASGQLGVDCQGVLSDGCKVGFALSVGPNIAVGVDVIEDGWLTVTRRSIQDKCPLLSAACAIDQHSIRIERLPHNRAGN